MFFGSKRAYISKKKIDKIQVAHEPPMPAAPAPPPPAAPAPPLFSVTSQPLIASASALPQAPVSSATTFFHSRLRWPPSL